MTRKTTFFEGQSGFKFNNLGVAQGIALKVCTTVAKGKRVKTKNQKVLGANSSVSKSYTGKPGREGLFSSAPPPPPPTPHPE